MERGRRYIGKECFNIAQRYMYIHEEFHRKTGYIHFGQFEISAAEI